MMFASEFERWLSEAKAGDSCIYFTGHMAEAAFRHERAAALRKAVHKAFDAAEVTLAQYRCGKKSFTYTAQRITDPARQAIIKKRAKHFRDIRDYRGADLKQAA